ncbi:Occludin/ELL family protein [Cyanobium sp. N5-Cardenillas]|uniref:Occludin/ELL family protein n=1 Tax=Cyanobium sp. N5-Cardenillas TaxID=2823720 RepID=UPI0020CEB89D|nr:Occludin/ELL family protein [Cyanobium sp. N5-Cardenillas]MCP9785195.1 Occludin/ELL family protein [Cyanobium sp. N5-Cardenillas]
MTVPILAVPASLAAPLSALVPLAAATLLAPAIAGPVLCTTTLEAPMAASAGTGPVEVTRCGVTRSAPEVMEQRFYSFSAPFAQGVNLLHQITDPLGLSIPGRDGGRIVAFGFPDQNIVWDGTAIENTASVMLTDQSPLMPLRTSDITNGFSTSLGAGAGPTYVRPPASTTWTPPIRGLW